jgi:hypothetical protein
MMYSNQLTFAFVCTGFQEVMPHDHFLVVGNVICVYPRLALVRTFPGDGTMETARLLELLIIFAY